MSKISSKKKSVYFKHDNKFYKYKKSLQEFKNEILDSYKVISCSIKENQCSLVDSIFAHIIHHDKKITNIEIEASETKKISKIHPVTKKNVTTYRKTPKQFSLSELESLNIKEEDVIQFDKLNFEFNEHKKILDITFDYEEILKCDV